MLIYINNYIQCILLIKAEPCIHVIITKRSFLYLKKIKPHILTITKDVKVITFLRHSTTQAI